MNNSEIHSSFFEGLFKRKSVFYSVYLFFVCVALLRTVTKAIKEIKCINYICSSITRIDLSLWCWQSAGRCWHTARTVTVIWSISVRSKVTGGFAGRSLLLHYRFVQAVLFKHCQRWDSVIVADGWDSRFYKLGCECVYVCLCSGSLICVCCTIV